MIITKAVQENRKAMSEPEYWIKLDVPFPTMLEFKEFIIVIIMLLLSIFDDISNNLKKKN